MNQHEQLSAVAEASRQARRQEYAAEKAQAEAVALRREHIMATLAGGWMAKEGDYRLTVEDLRDLRAMADAIMEAAR